MTKKTSFDIIFILTVSAVCHFLFSPYGFNPTDEGFVLSATDRVLHGQIPHLDFSSVRPLGYAYLHIPELLISKTHFFLVSRFVFWLEQVLIAFLWIRFVLDYTNKETSLFLKYSLIFICFAFNVHYFPSSVLHTIDGLLMCLIGLNLILSQSKWNVLGFFFIGFAALCKQNYLIILPVTLIIFNRQKIYLNLISGLSPIMIYIGLISFSGGLNDMIIQLGGHNELIKVGILTYLSNPMVYIGIIGIYLFSKFKSNQILFTFTVFLVAVLLLISNHYHGKYGFLFFGVLAGKIIPEIIKKKNILIPFIALLIAWSVSISVGYNTPALFNGGIISLFFMYSLTEKNNLSKTAVFAIILAITVMVFYIIREQNIYREDKASHLTYKLNGIVEGADGIYTNRNTCLVLKELDSLKKAIPNLVVIPDFTACNIMHSHKSKILTEWPNKTEIPNEKILQKITSKITMDSTVIFAIPKFQTALLKDGFVLIPNSGMEYPIINYVISNFQVADEKKYFICFRKIFPPSKVISENEYNNSH